MIPNDTCDIKITFEFNKAVSCIGNTLIIISKMLLRSFGEMPCM